MGICCCIKVNHQMSYKDDQVIRGQNQIYLFDKSSSKQSSTIYHKKKNQVSNISINKEVREKEDNYEKQHQDREKTNEFFTYFYYSQQISQIIHRNVIEQSSKFIQKEKHRKTNSQQVNKNKSDFLNQTNKNLVDQGQGQNDEGDIKGRIQIEQGLWQKYMEQGNRYLENLNNFMKTEFFSQLRTLSTVRKDQKIPKETFFKLLGQLLNQKKEQTKQSEPSFITRLKSDILAILNTQLHPQLKIPSKFNSTLRYTQAIQTEYQHQNSSIYNSWIKNSQKPFYIIKLELYSLTNLLSEPNKHLQKDNKIQIITITLTKPTIKSPLTLQPASQQILQIDAKLLSTKNGKKHRLQLIITPNTIIKFKTYPLESTLTLHAPEFLKFPYVNQLFPFAQIGQKIVQCARIGIRMQILSSNWSQTLLKLKLQTKNMLNQLEKIKRGQNTWEHLNALQSSYGSISQNQSSFMSYIENKTRFC